MDYYNRGWNETIVFTQVELEDAEVIQFPKIRSTAEHDLLGWHYNDFGIYTVKSGYWLATHLPDPVQIIPPPKNVEIKRMIWKTRTAPKLKHFL